MSEPQIAAGARGSKPPPETAPEGSRVIMRVFGRTDVGQVREHNEDNFLVADLSRRSRSLREEDRVQTIGAGGTLFAVCDGMGGAAAGEIASQLAVDIIYEHMIEGDSPNDRDDLARRVVRAIEAAGTRIYQEAKADRTRRGMGTTSTVAALLDDHLFFGQVGDSRGYVLRGNQLVQVTRDQSLVNQLIEAGQLTPEEAETFEHNNIILQALGTSDSVQVDLTCVELRRGDTVLLCSDGLSGMVRADEMREVLLSIEDPLEACRLLTERANEAGGHDNITCIVARFEGEGLREASSDDVLGYRKYTLPEEPHVDRTGPTQRLFITSSEPGSGDHALGSDEAPHSIKTSAALSAAPLGRAEAGSERPASSRRNEDVHLPFEAMPPWLIGLSLAFLFAFLAFMGFYLLR